MAAELCKAGALKHVAAFGIRAALAALACALLLAGPSAAAASPRRSTAKRPPQTTRPEAEELPAGYKEAFQRGSKEMQLGKFVEARAMFRNAHELYPNARTMRGLGKAEFELENYIASVRFLEQSLASDERPLPPDMREETAKLLAVARGLVTRLKLTLTPATARASLDGADVQLDKKHTVPVVVGKHDLVVQAPGHLTMRRTLDIQSGPQTSVEVSLLPVQQPEQPMSDDGPAVYERWWFWAAAGAVVAGAVVTGIVLANREPADPTPSDIPDVIASPAVLTFR